MSELAARWSQAPEWCVRLLSPIAQAGDVEIGRWVYTGLFGLLVAWLLLAPNERLGIAPGTPAWRNVRWWAVGVATVQMVVYALFSYH